MLFSYPVGTISRITFIASHESFQRLKQAVENENMYAMYQLGQIYEKGKIVQPDSDASYAFYEKALQQYALNAANALS